MTRPWETPEIQARVKKMLAHHNRVGRLTHWMRHIPLVGSLVETFWYCLLTEGVYQTLKPRWGALTFAFLNDGIKPTLWHTWYSVRHPHGEYAAIYTKGAPRNEREASQ